MSTGINKIEYKEYSEIEEGHMSNNEGYMSTMKDICP